MAQPQTSTDIVGSLVLLGAAALAVVIANTALADGYAEVLKFNLTIGFEPYAITDAVKDWIKNALMAVFFLLVGLEIKAEFKEGALAERQRAILPFAAAFGGMAFPALIYLGLAGGNSEHAAGWAIPCATDIAFAVGVVGLLGTRIPPGLKAFLLAVAVIDDLGAIMVIAFFYSGALSLAALGIAAATCAAMLALNLRNVSSPWPYLVLGLVLWVALYHSGINPTLGGVVTALFIPLKTADRSRSPLHEMAGALKLPVTFFIMPLFALANAGVPLGGLGLSDLLHPVTNGIALGLLIGKPVGIALCTFAVVAPSFARLPDGVGWTHVIGVGFIAGIGFTMSLFVGALAFDGAGLLNEVRLGVLSGSLLAGLIGAAILMAAKPLTPRTV